MPIGEHAPESTVTLLVRELQSIQTEIQRARSAVSRDARMNRDDKIYIYARLKAVDAITKKYLQLSLLSPQQRLLG